MDLSIILPYYGTIDLRVAELVISSALHQVGVRSRVVVVESGRHARMASMCRALGVAHVFVPAGKSAFSPGAIRNHGALESRSGLLYFSDGDVLLGRGHLKAMVETHESATGSPVGWPPMRRIPVEFVREFVREASQHGLKETLQSWDFRQRYVAVPRGASYEIRKVVRRRVTETGKTFTTTPELYEQYFEQGRHRGLEPIIWHQVVHMGALLVRRSDFIRVGGYCGSYAAWGNEDIDLQWKLRRTVGLQRARGQLDLEVLHLDHAKPYFRREGWAENKRRYRLRKKSGVAVAILRDVEVLRSLQRSARHVHAREPR